MKDIRIQITIPDRPVEIPLFFYNPGKEGLIIEKQGKQGLVLLREAKNSRVCI